MNSFDSRYMQLKINNLRAIISKKKKVTTVACEMDVSRQSVHKWLARYKRFGDEGLVTQRKKRTAKAHNRTSPEVEQLVINCAQQHWNDGVETLHDWLLYENNLDLHPSTIYRILKRNNIRYTTNQPRTRKKWKKKLYAHSVPGTELQMDTKYPYGYKQGKVIYTIIDDASRWVFVWSYSTANKENTIDFLSKVLKRTPFPIIKVRTDNGKEFIARVVKDYLKRHHILHRTNTPYCPEENGKIERFHRTLNEKALRFSFYPKMSLDEMQYRLSLFLYYYNTQKKHRGLGMDGMT